MSIRINTECDIDVRMQPVVNSFIAAFLVGVALLFAGVALAAPMRCTGEQKTCIAACNKSLDRSSLSTCVTNCGLRQSFCMKTGCWDTGFQKYCGLLKQ